MAKFDDAQVTQLRTIVREVVKPLIPTTEDIQAVVKPLIPTTEDIQAVVKPLIPTVDQIRGIVREEVRPIVRQEVRLIVREEVRAEVATQLAVQLQPLKDDIAAVRRATVEDTDLIVTQQLTLRRTVANHEGRIKKLEAVHRSDS